MTDDTRSDGERRTTEPVETIDVAHMLTRACEVLRDAKRILLTSHRRPDGDGTGSMAGLASLLRAQGKEAVIFGSDGMDSDDFTEPGSYQFACHLLDHYQRGMVVEIEVVETAAAGLSAADRDYVNEMSVIDTTVRESLARYDELAQEPQYVNPERLFKTAFEFALWRSGYENALALEPPPAFAESHGLYLEALGLLAEVSDDVAAAADEGDLIGLMQIGPKITRATGLLDQATELMENVVAEQGG